MPINTMQLPARLRSKMVAQKIEPQFPASPEGCLMFAVVRQALFDASEKPPNPNAVSYLSRDMVHAEVCGVSSEWIRSVIHTVNQGGEVHL